MDINIFLASSSELKEDRVHFQIFINQLNDEWCERDICFKLTIWEDFIDSLSKNGLQNEYDKAVQESDIFLMLFFTKVGKYTAQEFEAAFKQFQLDEKPRIYTYFKEAFIFSGDIDEEIISMIEFKKKLSELNHYISNYTGIEDLKWKFSRQLEKIYGNRFSSNHDLNTLSKTQVDSLAIQSVCRFFSPQVDKTTIKDLNLQGLITNASEFGRNAVFQLAKVNRRSNRTNDRELMARSIPVFEALVDLNIRRDRHYYFGQLAYALKDQDRPCWSKAEENFNIAIDIRGDSEPEYFYEFNRAICRVSNDSNMSTSIPSDSKVQEAVLQDLRYAKKGIGRQFDNLINSQYDNKIIIKWLKNNNLKLEDI